jgi:hypothetical protein
MNEKLDQQFKEIIERNDSMLTVSELADIVQEIEVFEDIEQYVYDRVKTALGEMDERELISMYNEYLSDNYYEEYWENTEENINMIFEGKTPYEIIGSIDDNYYSNCADYFKINDYGKLLSADSSDVVDEALEDEGFIRDIIDNQTNFDSDITELFDELDTIKEAWELVEKENSKE